jgi:hypothetical protein
MAAQYTHSVVSADRMYAYRQYRDMEVATKQSSYRQPPGTRTRKSGTPTVADTDPRSVSRIVLPQGSESFPLYNTAESDIRVKACVRIFYNLPSQHLEV